MSVLSQYKFNFTCLSYDVLDIEIFPTLFVTYCIHLFILHTLLILRKRLTGCRVKMMLDNVRRWSLQEKRKSMQKCLVCECCATGKSNRWASRGSTSRGGVHHAGEVHHTTDRDVLPRDAHQLDFFIAQYSHTKHFRTLFLFSCNHHRLTLSNVSLTWHPVSLFRNIISVCRMNKWIQ